MEHRSAQNKPGRVQIEFPLETMTVQSEAEACDINNILKKYERTGLIDHVKEGGRYEDLPPGLDYQEALNLVIEAKTSFEGLPAAVRKEFENDPAKFLAFVEDPENVERMGELGLLKERIPDDKVDDTKAKPSKPSQEAQGENSDEETT